MSGSQWAIISVEWGIASQRQAPDERISVYIDDRRVGSLQYGELKAFIVPPGPHNLFVKHGRQLSPGMVLQCHHGKTVELECRQLGQHASILSRLLLGQDRLCCNLK